MSEGHWEDTAVRQHYSVNGIHGSFHAFGTDQVGPWNRYCTSRVPSDIKVDQQQASWAFACLWCCDCFKACLPAEKLPRWARTSLRWETHVAVKKLRRFFLVCSVFYLYCLLASKGNCPFFTFVHQNKPKFLKRVHFPGVCQWVSSKISGSLASSLVMIPATASLGNLLSLLVTFSFEGALGDGAMTQWGWRLPFLLALLPGSLAIWGRRRLGETAMFLASEAEEQLETGKAKRAMIKIRELVASYWPQVQAQKIDGWVGWRWGLFFCDSCRFESFSSVLGSWWVRARELQRRSPL